MFLRSAILLVVLSVPSGCVLAAEELPKGWEDGFRRACADFLVKPPTREGRVAAKQILEVAVKSEAVDVTISTDFCPWMAPGKDYKHAELLLAAYVAGNCLAQLDSGVAANDPYSGAIQVFRVYRHLKSQDASYAVSEIDALLALHKKGELAAHFAKAAKQDKP